MAHTSNHYGVHNISSAALIAAIDSVAEAVSGMILIPTGPNNNQVAVIGVN